MAYQDDRQDESSFDNRATQEKLAAWWSGLKPEDRKRMLGVVKAKKTLERSWDELPPETRRALFHAGVFMRRITKDFP